MREQRPRGTQPPTAVGPPLATTAPRGSRHLETKRAVRVEEEMFYAAQIGLSNVPGPDSRRVDCTRRMVPLGSVPLPLSVDCPRRTIPLSTAQVRVLVVETANKRASPARHPPRGPAPARAFGLFWFSRVEEKVLCPRPKTLNNASPQNLLVGLSLLVAGSTP